jgi:hypothetical protein
MRRFFLGPLLEAPPVHAQPRCRYFKGSGKATVLWSSRSRRVTIRSRQEHEQRRLRRLHRERRRQQDGGEGDAQWGSLLLDGGQQTADVGLRLRQGRAQRATAANVK